MTVAINIGETLTSKQSVEFQIWTGVFAEVMAVPVTLPSYDDTMCFLPESTSMDISGLLGEFCRSFLCLFCVISGSFPASIKTSKSLLMQAIFSEVDERQPSSLGRIFSCSDGTTWKDATRHVDLPEIHAVNGHSVGTCCTSSALFLILSSSVWFLHPRRHSLFFFFAATLSNLKTILQEG